MTDETDAGAPVDAAAPADPPEAPTDQDGPGDGTDALSAADEGEEPVPEQHVAEWDDDDAARVPPSA